MKSSQVKVTIVKCTKICVKGLTVNRSQKNRWHVQLVCDVMKQTKKHDLKAITESSTHVDPQERNELYKLLKKYEYFFNGNIGTWHSKIYGIKLKSDAEPHHGKPFPVPCIHELTFKQELDWLEALNIIKKVKLHQWGASTFIIP